MTKKKPSKLRPKLKGYTNWVKVHAIAPFDIRIDFLFLEIEENPIELAQLHMSPQSAKALLTMLRGVIGEFERRFGEIKIKPDEIDFGESGRRF